MTRAAPRLALLALACASAAPLAAQEVAPVASPGGGAPAFLHEPDEDPVPARWGRGPLEVRDPFLLALARLSPWARSPAVLEHLQVEVSLRALWSNSFAFARNRYLIDGEVLELAPVVRLGLFERLELGLFLPIQVRSGGSLDGFIEGFHRAFALPGMDRDKVPRDRWEISGREPGRPAFHLTQAGAGVGDLITEARVLLTRGGELLPAATLGLRLRWPTGKRGFDLSDGVDASFALDLSQRLGARSPFVVYAGGAWTLHYQNHLDEIRQARNRGMFYVGGEVELTSWLSFVVHAWIESIRETRLLRHVPASGGGLLDPFRGTDLTFGNWLTYVAVGFKVEPTPGLLFEIGVLENIIDPETTSDFGVVMNLTWRI